MPSSLDPTMSIDIQQTKDGTLILMHDFNLKRTTGINKEPGKST